MPGDLELASQDLVTALTFLSEGLSAVLAGRMLCVVVVPSPGRSCWVPAGLAPCEVTLEEMGGEPLVLRLSCYLKQPPLSSPWKKKMDFSGFCQSL